MIRVTGYGLRVTGTILLFSGALLLSGCQPAGTRASAQQAASPEAKALDSHLAALEEQIARLERDLGKGRGAYRDGSMLRIDGKNRDEPPLERLRRQERELADAQAQIASRDLRVTELTRDLAAARDQGKTLGEQASDLTYARDALVTAQQALAEARASADGLRAQLTTSELQRLKAEREQFRFSARLLRLAPGQTTQLLDLQEEIRETVRSSGSPSAAPAAETPAKGAH